MSIELTIADFEPKCAAQHLGLWLIEPLWFAHAVEAVKNGVWTPGSGAGPRKVETHRAAEGDGGTRVMTAAPGQVIDPEDPEGLRVLYTRTPDGLAIIEVSGPMMKGDSKYGGTSTVRTRRAIREAVADKAVEGLMLIIDSPGGTVAGTAALGDDVAAANKAKPVYAHVTDLGASAAYWVGSQARQLFADRTAEIGSIGAVAVVEDFAARATMLGIKVHVISTGEYKGAFVPGAEVPQKHLDALQQRIDELQEHFLAAVSAGRRMKVAQVQALADGRVHIAAKAADMGLIDGVQSADETASQLLAAIRAAPGKNPRRRSAAVRMAVMGS